MNIRRAMDDCCNGTCLQGYVNVTYDRLVEVFGEPHSDGDGYKVDAEWMLAIDEEICTIYNWKNGKNYLASRGLSIDRITEWNIGGHNKEAVAKVHLALMR